MSVPSPGKKPKKPAANTNKQPSKKDEGSATPLVECPPEIGAVARQEWDRVAPELAAVGRLTALDRAPLAVYCNAYAAWLEAVAALQQYGTMLKSPNGYPLQSPYVSVANKNADLMLQIAADFGFTPASRMRMQGSTIEFLSLDDPRSFTASLK